MTSFPPPYPYFNGIIYDQTFFNQTSELTLAQANAKFLKKTTPDTATALETFTAGIKTDTINPTTSGGTIQIGHEATTNNVEVASQINRSTVLHLGDGNTSSGAIHLGNGTGSSNNVQILNGNYSSGQTAGQVNILTGTHAVGSFGGNMGLFTGSRGTLTIGNAVNNQILFQKQPQFNQGIISDDIDGLVPTSAPTIYSDITTGNIQIAQGQTTGTIAIGNGSNRNGTIGIGQNTKGNISIANNMTAGSNTIVIGTTNIGTCNLKGTFVRLNDTGTGAVEIGNATTSSITAFRPIRVSYPTSALTVNTMIGFRFQTDIQNTTINTTRRCQCAILSDGLPNSFGAVLPAGVYAVSYMVVLRTTTTGYVTGIAVTPTVQNNVTSATGGVLNTYGGIVVNSTTSNAPINITGSTFLTLDGTSCVSVGVESTTTNTGNVDIYCQAIRIA